MQCLQVTPDGYLVQQMPADPNCAGGIAVVEPSDIPPNPFYMSTEDGLLVSGAICSVWLLAWSIRAVRSVLSDRDND